MGEQSDKSKTVEFNRIKDDGYREKEPVERSREDIYSEARRENYAQSDYDDENDSGEKKDKTLVYTAIGLAVLLVIIVIAGVFIINNGGIGKKETKDENIGVITNEEEVKENDEKEIDIPKDEPEENSEKNQSIKSSVVFYGDSVENKGDYYIIKADLYDRSFKRTDSRKVIINSSTVIKENGKRITPDALAYIVENLAGEMIIFDGEIRESDNFAISLSFSGSFKEHVEEETPPPEDNKTDNEENNTEPEENENAGETENQGDVSLTEENKESKNILEN